MRDRWLFVCTLPLVLLAAEAEAQSSVFAGGMAGEDYSAYVGAQRRVAEAPSGAWAVRGGLAAGRYDYQSNGAEIDGRFAQIQATVLREWFSGSTYAAVGLGARYADTRLKPDDPGNDREGGRLDGVVTAEAIWSGDAWKTEAYGEYGVDLAAYYVRLGATRGIGGPWRAGLEALAEGDRTYSRRGVGLVLAWAPTSSGEFRLSAGAMDREADDGAYVAVAWRRSF